MDSTRSVIRPVLAAALALLLALGAASVPAPVSAAMPDAESRMLGHLNSARSGNGLGSLSAHNGLTKIARGWAAQMARDYDAGGSRQGALRHNPSMASQLPSGYRRAGENVGYSVLTGASHSKLVDRLHDAYMASSGHRANILGKFDRVGVGLVMADDGTMWSAVVFMLEGASEPEPKPEPEPEPEPKEETATESESASSAGGGSQSGSSSGSGSGSGSSGSGPSASASEPEPPAPPPDPPSTEDLFGPGWPKGYLSGDPGAGKNFLAGLHGVRAVVSLLPGSGPGGTTPSQTPVASR